MHDLEQAIHLLEEERSTCVLCKGDLIYTSEKRGIAPLVGWLEAGTDLQGFSAADKIVGKAAALLFSLAGIRALYAPVMSEEAVSVLTRHGIETACGQSVPMIINRQGSGPCPMEQAVKGIENPQEALQAVQHTLKKLHAEKMEDEPT